MKEVVEQYGGLAIGVISGLMLLRLLAAVFLAADGSLGGLFTEYIGFYM